MYFRLKAWFTLGDKGDNCDTIRMRYDKNAIVFPLVSEIIAHYIAFFFFLKKHCSNNSLKNSLKMACLSKLDRHLRLRRKIKVYYNNYAKSSSTSCLERQKAKKGMGQGNKYTKTETPMEIFQRYSIPRTSCRPRVVTLCLLYFKNTNFRTLERMRRRGIL